MGAEINDYIRNRVDLTQYFSQLKAQYAQKREETIGSVSAAAKDSIPQDFSQTKFVKAAVSGNANYIDLLA
jgi:hypothetical protein